MKKSHLGKLIDCRYCDLVFLDYISSQRKIMAKIKKAVSLIIEMKRIIDFLLKLFKKGCYCREGGEI